MVRNLAQARLAANGTLGAVRGQPCMLAALTTRGPMMFQHYRTEIVSDEALETLLRAADADDSCYPRYVTADQIDADEDDAVDSWMFGLLEVLAFPEDDEYGRPSIGPDDVFAAADECGLVIATVYQSLSREERVI